MSIYGPNSLLTALSGIGFNNRNIIVATIAGTQLTTVSLLNNENIVDIDLLTNILNSVDSDSDRGFIIIRGVDTVFADDTTRNDYVNAFSNAYDGLDCLDLLVVDWKKGIQWSDICTDDLCCSEKHPLKYNSYIPVKEDDDDDEDMSVVSPTIDELMTLVKSIEL